MNSVIDSVLEGYLTTYRDLIETERDERSITLSLPFHLAANHRIEITVTDLGGNICIISDSARTLSEIQAAGYSLTTQMKEKLEKIAGISGLRIVDSHLILEARHDDIGTSVQKFLEVSKMIGDAYLVYKHREKPDEEILSHVQSILQEQGVLYRLREKVPGEIETHPFDLLAPPNGRPGLAVSVLGGVNTHNIAQVWGFKCDDIKKGEWYRSTKSRLALIYDVRQQWSDASRTILQTRADIAFPSDGLTLFAEAVKRT